MRFSSPLISISLFFTLGCASIDDDRKGRSPNQVGNDFEFLDNRNHFEHQRITTFDQKHEYAISNPWAFTQANRFCKNSLSKSQLDDYVDENYPEFESAEEILQNSTRLSKIQKYILELNKWSFNQLACDTKYQKILLMLTNEAAIPKYIKYGESGYAATAFPSMAFDSVVTTPVKSLVEKPNFLRAPETNLERLMKSGNTKNKIELTNDSKSINPTNLFSQSIDDTSGLCGHIIMTSQDQNYYDFVIANCFSRSPFAKVVEINKRRILFYLHYDWTSGKNYFELKAHTIRNLSEEEYKNQLERNKSQVTASLDPTVLALNLNKSVTFNADEVFVPTGFDVVEINENKFRFIYSVFNEAQSQIITYTFDQNFQNIQFEYQAPRFENGYLSIAETYHDQILYYKTTFDRNVKLVTHNLTTLKTTEKSMLSSFTENSEPPVSRIFLYATKDGKKLPLTLSHAKNYDHFKESNFGVVESYGGFNIITPTYIDYDHRVIIQRGGFVANVVVRGGGEMGPKEWKSAYGLNRNLSSEDLNSATEFLIRKGYARQKRIALRGGSNGGLLVLSAVMKRPELYGAIIALAPVTSPIDPATRNGNEIGWGLSDYGDISDNKIQEFWRKNSPLNNLAKIKEIPPILLRTAYDDQNVSPKHSVFLFSELSKRPDRDKFLFYYMPVGYGHNPPNVRKMIEESSYQLSFLFRIFNVSM